MKDFLLHLLSKIKVKKPESRSFFSLFREFKDILKMNNKVLELIADTNDKLSGDYIFDQHYIKATTQEICNLVEKMVFGLDNLVHHRYPNLHSVFLRIKDDIEDEFLLQKRKISTEFIIPYGQVTRDIADDVGGKNANLAELGNVLKLRTPEGFAITSAAYHAFLEYNGLLPFIDRICSEWQSGKCSSAEASQQIRRQMQKAVLPKKLRRDLRNAMEKILTGPADTMAFRSSAMGEDGSYSFAGQYTSEINISPRD
ncbi:MAG: PEP/pyruvate-binding domain-containing protein, partial [Desulfobulbaceae bacterium]|nr:PEP/pyruvate-binding domain-containing protein [Desulfobulbaceae bacterium]